jgi:hypothetical protein
MMYLGALSEELSAKVLYIIGTQHDSLVDARATVHEMFINSHVQRQPLQAAQADEAIR